MTTIDPAIERGVQLQLQRDPPFTDEDLAGVPLEGLVVEVSAVSDLSVVADLPDLLMLSARNNAIVDIDVLAEAGREFMELDLTGNPLSDRAYYEVVPAVRDRVEDLRVSGEGSGSSPAGCTRPACRSTTTATTMGTGCAGPGWNTPTTRAPTTWGSGRTNSKRSWTGTHP
ncbi:hypothetical protein GCM10029964_004380 [Kibdelosporangium lantanae]